MKKRIILIAAALLLCGCGSTAETNENETTIPASESVQQTEETTHTAAEILDMIAASCKADVLDERADFGSDTFTNACSKLYGVSADTLTDGGIVYVSSGQQSDEISILKGADISVLKDRAETRSHDFEGYAPTESEKAKKAVVFEHNGFAVLIISDNAEELKKLITEF